MGLHGAADLLGRAQGFQTPAHHLSDSRFGLGRHRADGGHAADRADPHSLAQQPEDLRAFLRRQFRQDYRDRLRVLGLQDGRQFPLVRRTDGHEWIALLKQILDLLLHLLGLVLAYCVLEDLAQEVLELKSRFTSQRLAELPGDLGGLLGISVAGGVEVAQLDGQLPNHSGIHALEQLRGGGRIETGQKQGGLLFSGQCHVFRHSFSSIQFRNISRTWSGLFLRAWVICRRSRTGSAAGLP